MSTDNFKAPTSYVASHCKKLAIRAEIRLNRRKRAAKFLAIAAQAAKHGNKELYITAASKAYVLQGVNEREAYDRARLEALQLRVH
jgi:hypothetical protein